jgi:hypothetical protein
VNRFAELCGDAVVGLAAVLSLPFAIVAVGLPVALAVKLILGLLDRL